MIQIHNNIETCIRRAKLAEIKLNKNFGDYNRLKFFRSEEPIAHTGGAAYTLYIKSGNDILHETYILKDSI